MHRLRRVSLILGVAYAAAGLAGCGGDSGTAPSGTPQVVEGTVNLPPLNLDAISFQINRGGVLSSRVDWNDPTNDIDTGLLPSTCTANQIVTDAAGCAEEDAVAFEDSLSKPSQFTAPVTPGAYTVVLFNLGPGADTVSYRFEVN